MDCDSELLQAYLDGELEEGKVREVGEHLAGCRTCRRELSRLKLLWLELSQKEETPLPPEWPYLRQRVFEAAMAERARPREERPGFWETQRLAWQPFSLAAVYLPGRAEVVKLARTAGREMPGLAFGLLTATGRLLRGLRQPNRRGGSSR